MENKAKTIEQRGNSEKIIEMPNRSEASTREIIREMTQINKRMEYFEGRIDQYKKSMDERGEFNGERYYFLTEVPAAIISKVDDLILDYYIGEVAYGEACLDHCAAQMKEGNTTRINATGAP